MKIGFLIPFFYPKTGGAENNCLFTARELAKKHEVHVFCSGEKDSEEEYFNIKVHRSKETFRYRYYFAFYPGIIKKLLSVELDVLHVHGFGFIQQDRAVRRLKKEFPKTKLVCTPHGPFMALSNYPLIAKIYKSLYMPSIKKSLKNYDAIIQVNPYQKDWMIKDYEIKSEKIHFVPNGINEEVFKKISNKEKNNILKKFDLKKSFVITYLGRIQEYKGIDQVLEVLPDLKKVKSNIKFVAMGEDAGDTERLTEIATNISVMENFILTGKVSENEKLAILDQSEIFIFPSEWEAFGIVVLEAMARKNAIVSTSTEGGKFLIEDGKNGFLFNYKDKEGLLKSLRKTISEDKQRKKMQNNNFIKSKGFLWKDIAQQLAKLYGEVKNEDTRIN
jgi:glycosyltransferase involved in cell wall biosynthesis